MEEIPERAEEDREMGTAEIRMDVENAVARLPEELKETAILFFFQGMKQREIAKLMDIKLSLVKYRVTRAKKLLGEYLGRGDESVMQDDALQAGGIPRNKAVSEGNPHRKEES